MLKVRIAYRVHNKQQLSIVVEKVKRQGIHVNAHFISHALHSGYLPELCVIQLTTGETLTYCNVGWFKNEGIPIVPFLDFEDYYNKI